MHAAICTLRFGECAREGPQSPALGGALLLLRIHQASVLPWPGDCFLLHIALGMSLHLGRASTMGDGPSLAAAGTGVGSCTLPVPPTPAKSSICSRLLSLKLGRVCCAKVPVQTARRTEPHVLPGINLHTRSFPAAFRLPLPSEHRSHVGLWLPAADGGC